MRFCRRFSLISVSTRARRFRLDTLVADGALSPNDRAFLETHAVDYKPHALNAHHAGDMFHIPTESGCMFIGPVGPPLPKRSAQLSDLTGIIERVHRLPGPTDALMLHIELTAQDGVAISPGFLDFILRSPDWRARAAAVKSVAAEHGLSPAQDSPDIQGNYLLAFTPANEVSSIALDLLRRGLGLPDSEQITYSCGALETG